MWVNAQRDDRRAEYSWRPLQKFRNSIPCTTPQSLADAHYWSACSAVTLPRRETCWNLQGCPKLTKGSQPIVGRSSPYCKDMWRRYWCLTGFFPIVDICLSCEDIARRSCAMVPRWRFLATFLRPVFAASRVQQVSDLHSKFALRPYAMCQSMINIQSPTAEIRRGKKEWRRRRRRNSMKILWSALLHRATIIKERNILVTNCSTQ